MPDPYHVYQHGNSLSSPLVDPSDRLPRRPEGGHFSPIFPLPKARVRRGRVLLGQPA